MALLKGEMVTKRRSSMSAVGIENMVLLMLEVFPTLKPQATAGKKQI